MESEPVAVPGSRDVRGTLDRPDADAAAVVVACPPHPRMGGDRSDRRLRTLSEDLRGRGVACLRFDYGPWDGGQSERDDARNALTWAGGRFEHVGLFGYSFGAGVALSAAAGRGAAEGPNAAGSLAAVSALAPDAEAADTLGGVTCPLQIGYGVRDDTVDPRPVADRAAELNAGGRDPPIDLVEWSADHHFVGQATKVAAAVGAFLAGHLTT